MIITFCAVVAYRVYDEFPLKNIVSHQDGSLTVTMKMTDGDWLLQYLLSYGSDVKVIAPQALKDALKQKAVEIINLYH